MKLHSLVAEWVRKANQDYDVAEYLASPASRFREAIGFHSQQAVEKYLKAVLCWFGVKWRASALH